MSSYEERIEHAKSLSIDTDRFIISTPDTCLGSPRLYGTRLRVEDIVSMVKTEKRR